MKILILGGDGMLGHKLYLKFRDEFDVKVTLRKDIVDYGRYNFFNADNAYGNINANNITSLEKIILDFRPDIIINTIGIIKQRKEAKDIETSLVVNALFPHKLYFLCYRNNIRLIHISTDCIFSGKDGDYKEDSFPDAVDIYGRTKYLGEIKEEFAITLRTSFIGRELYNKKSILEWFLSQKGSIEGYQKYVYSGLTTVELSHIIKMIIQNFSDMKGVYHVSSTPINKYELLLKLKEKINKQDVDIRPTTNIRCNRSLNANLFKNITGYVAPDWDHMVDELIHDMDLVCY